MRKFHEAKINNNKSVEIWGTGKPLREFLHVDDLADACVYLMNNLDAKTLYSSEISHINIGSGEEISIKKLAIMIKKVIDYKGDLVFNSDYPDGTPRKLLDVSRLNTMGWKSKIKLEDGLKSVYEWYLGNMRTD
jgi:GDP-L-fucose synthase